VCCGGPIERALARLLIAAYKRRLRAIVKVVPAWASEEILSTSEHGKAAPLFDFYPELQYTMCAWPGGALDPGGIGRSSKSAQEVYTA
jgi:hypothetical protein